MTGQVDSERNLNMGRRWFTEGRGRDIALADDISRSISRICSQRTIKPSRGLPGAGLVLAHMRASRPAASECRSGLCRLALRRRRNG
jgi:hypothetical protein